MLVKTTLDKSHAYTFYFDLFPYLYHGWVHRFGRTISMPHLAGIWCNIPAVEACIVLRLMLAAASERG